MITNQQPTQCPYCESPLVEKSGTSRKTGNSYYFWGCASYPQCQYTWRPQDSPATQSHPQRQTERQNSDLIVGRLNMLEKMIEGEFKSLNERLNGLGKFLAEKEK